MKRRDLFKMLGTLAAVPFVASLATLFTRCTGKKTPDMKAVIPAACCLTANDDLFGSEQTFLTKGQQDAVVKDGVDKWNYWTPAEQSTLRLARGVPPDLQEEDLRYSVVPHYRRVGEFA